MQGLAGSCMVLYKYGHRALKETFSETSLRIGVQLASIQI